MLLKERHDELRLLTDRLSRIVRTVRNLFNLGAGAGPAVLLTPWMGTASRGCSSSRVLHNPRIDCTWTRIRRHRSPRFPPKRTGLHGRRRESHRTPPEAGPAAHPARPADQLRPARRAKNPHLFQDNHTSESECAPRRQGSAAPVGELEDPPNIGVPPTARCCGAAGIVRRTACACAHRRQGAPPPLRGASGPDAGSAHARPEGARHESEAFAVRGY